MFIFFLEQMKSDYGKENMKNHQENKANVKKTLSDR